MKLNIVGWAPKFEKKMEMVKGMPVLGLVLLLIIGLDGVCCGYTRPPPRKTIYVADTDDSDSPQQVLTCISSNFMFSISVWMNNWWLNNLRAFALQRNLEGVLFCIFRCLNFWFLGDFFFLIIVIIIDTCWYVCLCPLRCLVEKMIWCWIPNLNRKVGKIGLIWLGSTPIWLWNWGKWGSGFCSCVCRSGWQHKYLAFLP